MPTEKQVPWFACLPVSAGLTLTPPRRCNSSWSSQTSFPLSWSILCPSSVLRSHSWLHSVSTLITSYICSCFRGHLHLLLGWECPYSTDCILFLLCPGHLALFLAPSKHSATWNEYIHIMRGLRLLSGVCKAEPSRCGGPHSHSSYLCQSDKGMEDSLNLGVPVEQQEFHASTPAGSFWGESANGLCHFEGDVCQARLWCVLSTAGVCQPQASASRSTSNPLVSPCVQECEAWLPLGSKNASGWVLWNPNLSSRLYSLGITTFIVK